MPSRQDLSLKLAKARQQLQKVQSRVAELEAQLFEEQPNLANLATPEDRYRRTLDNLREGCQIIGFDWRYVYVNDTAARQGSHTKDELLGSTMMEQYPGIEKTPMFAVLQRCMQERSIERVEHDVHYPDGVTVWFELLVQPVPEGIFTLSLDITARKLDEQALQQTEGRYRLLAENIADIIMTFSLERIITYMSPSCEKLLGYSPEEVEGRSHSEFIHPEDYPQVIDRTRQAVASKADFYTNQFRLRHKAGHYLWYEVRTRIVSDPDTGKVVQFISVLRDISERKAAEAKRHDAEQRYYSLFEQAHDAVFLLDMHGNHLEVNRRATELLGYTVSELQQLGFRDISDESSESQAVFEGLLAGKEFPMYERVFRKKDGSRVPVEVNVEVVWDANGSPLHIQSVVRDITERKQAEDALRESEEKYRSLVETMRGGLAVFDTDFRITFVNDRLCELLGYSREEAIGTRPTDLVDAVDVPLVQSHLARRQNVESTSYEVPVRHKDGHQIFMLMSGSPLLDKRGNYNGSIVVATDISVQKQAEAALRQALAKEKELSELKTRFVSMASHEFRTPLATILALVETLSVYRHKLSEEQINGRLDKIKDQIGRLKAVMDDVLMLARMQARRVEFNPMKLDLDALIHSVIDEFESRADIKNELDYTVGEGNREVLLDSKLMRQIINNLVSNATKYSPEDKVVRIHLEVADSEVILTIRDEGIGIPEADLPHLFEPFHRAANVGTISGTGLGLVITKEAVDLHGGTIIVESQPGAGTTFTIRIPIAAMDF